MSKWLVVFETLIRVIVPVIAVLDAHQGHGSFKLQVTVADAATGAPLDTVDAGVVSV